MERLKLIFLIFNGLFILKVSSDEGILHTPPLFPQDVDVDIPYGFTNIPKEVEGIFSVLDKEDIIYGEKVIQYLKDNYDSTILNISISCLRDVIGVYMELQKPNPAMYARRSMYLTCSS